MVKTISNMIALGTPAPHFALSDAISDTIVTLNNKHTWQALVIMFICNHCPFVKHVNQELTRIANDYMPQGVTFIAINSNDIVNYPDDSPSNMKKVAKEQHYPFPYLFDSTQEVAKAYQAACTPDFFVFNEQGLLCYRGQLDDSRPGNNIPVTGNDIRDALDKILTGSAISAIQKPSIGCNIKWKD